MFSGVVLGAFGAHFLRTRLDTHLFEVFETGTRYQLIHGLALLLVASLSERLSTKQLCIAGWCFFLGTLIFSGSLYTLALTHISVFGAITPVGGLLFLVGWATLFLSSPE